MADCTVIKWSFDGHQTVWSLKGHQMVWSLKATKWSFDGHQTVWNLKGHQMVWSLKGRTHLGLVYRDDVPTVPLQREVGHI